MDATHALLLKTYDSETDGRARFMGHTAFEDPGTPPDAARRESIAAIATWGAGRPPSGGRTGAPGSAR